VVALSVCLAVTTAGELLLLREWLAQMTSDLAIVVISLLLRLGTDSGRVRSTAPRPDRAA
jgi:hypothetical protein